MATGFVVNPASASFDLIKADLELFIASRPDAAKWKGFFDSQVGTMVVELIAGMSAFMKYDTIVSRREAFGQYAQNRSSVIGYAEGMGYSAFRGRNKILKLTVIPSTTGLLSKYFVVGTAKDADLILLEDTVVNEGVPVDLTVVVGQLKTESIQSPTVSPTAFRFTAPLVSSDLRVKLNGVVVPHSELILDMINEKFVAISNVNDSVDVFYLNLSTFLTRYAVGDIITLEYVERKDWGIADSDVIFGLGTISNIETISVYEDVEETESVRINAPLFNETQFVIRGRSDYAKTFRLLDSSIVDTDYKDVSAAVVDLFYVRDDNSVFTAAEKAQFVSKLSSFRPMGLLPPMITDPTIVFLELAVSLVLDTTQPQGNPNVAVESVISTYENDLGAEILFPDLENRIEDNQFIKIARIKIASTPWDPSHLYVRGAHVRPISDNGKVYEAIKFLYFSGAVQPVFPINPGDQVEDGDLLWQNCGAVGSCDTPDVWQSSHAYDIGAVVRPNPANGFMYCLVEQLNKSASSQETQHIAFAAVPTSGTWRLEYNGSEFTTDLAYNASAGAVQSALNALTSLSGVIVTGNYASGFDVVFGGADANRAQPQLTLAGAGRNEIHCIFFDVTPNAGQWVLDFQGQQTAPLAFNISNAALQSALEALPTIGVGNVQVDSGVGGEVYRVQFKGALALKPMPGPTTVFSNALFAATPVTPSVAVIQEGSAPSAGNNEVQLISFSLLPNVGDWSINFNGQTTALLDFDATNTEVQTALENLSNIAPGDVVVTGNFSTGFTLAFSGAWALQNLPEVTVVSNTLVKLTSTTITQSVIAAGGGGFNEIQKLAFSLIPTAGSFRLQFTYAGVAEITDVEVIADVTDSLRSKYWYFDTPTTDYYVWYKTSGVGTDPGPISGRVGIMVDIPTNSSAATVQSATVLAINTAASGVVSASSQPNNRVRLTNVAVGAVPDATPQNTNFIITVITDGVNPLQQTPLMPFNSTAGAIQAQLEGLPNIGPNNCQVTGNYSEGFLVEFLGALANTNVPNLVVDSNTLTTSQNVAIIPSTPTEGAPAVAGINEVQQINFDFIPDSGKFNLQFGVDTTVDIPFSADAAAVASALNALPTLSGVMVSGSFAAGFLITFAGADGNQNQPLLLITGNTLAASSAPVTIDIQICQAGQRPAQNLFNGVTPVPVTVTTTTDAISPEPNWAAAVGIADICP